MSLRFKYYNKHYFNILLFRLKRQAIRQPDALRDDVTTVKTIKDKSAGKDLAEYFSGVYSAKQFLVYCALCKHRKTLRRFRETLNSLLVLGLIGKR